MRLARRETGSSPPVKYFTDCSKAFSFVDLLCFSSVSLCTSVYMCFVVTCWERADLLALVCGLAVSLSLSHWYRGVSGVVLDCIDS